ncbi:outer membrane protein assembly factor BamE (lipoprotein component of BamABCDE complex) [Ureibacillus xyleni]|uniref:Outer membrane protein assembly factor BamE (Lipoprotein component of BamABCDE complex) n=1 Tax=Ureibacillus xyleni TaxID=614648 RepID=A0A285TIC6_9BACL|nr:hypothetical protein [Ureibacillus xyleni]SOC21755.1 outer membrane protein assembly factor BamE (lipoprotein component of BamABCDE complex) [Ureibacillus xyleni]
MFRKFLILTISVFFILSGCEILTKDSYDFYDEVNTTDLSNESINNIKIGSSKNEIIKVLGTPEQVEQSDDIYKNIVYEKQGLNFLLENNKLVEYRVSVKKYPSSKQVKVGDKKQDVIDKYGEDYYIKKDGDGTVASIGYFDKTNYLHMEFGLLDDKVIFIIVVDIS